MKSGVDKSIRFIKAFVAAVILNVVGVSGAAIAATGSFYAGGDIGATHFAGDGPTDSLLFQRGQRFGDSDVSDGIHVGYHITDWLAVEIGYMDFGSATQQFKISPDVIFIVAPRDTQTLEAKGASLAVVGNYELNSRISLFGALGIANMNYENTLSGGFSEVTGDYSSTDSYAEQGILYGLGVRYKLTGSVAVRADLRRYDVGDFVLDSRTVGVDFSF